MKASDFAFLNGKASKDLFEGFVDILCTRNSVSLKDFRGSSKIFWVVCLGGVDLKKFAVGCNATQGF